jgi:NAD(P)-dependent dehydrogenase (short-subunit alcohol dehydrogenase family)
MTFFPYPEKTPLAALTSLSGRTALVTGGAIGIGRGIAERLHEAGANVTIADIDGSAAARAADELGPERVHAVAGDVSKAADTAAMVAAAVEKFGALDILVNNAGVYKMYEFLDIDLEDARRTLDVNLIGVLACSQAAARQMIEQGRGGRIITVSSVEGLNPTQLLLGHYSASKHGVNGLLKTMTLALAPHGITVNSVAPGGIRTPGLGPLDQEVLAAFEATVPMGRMGLPDDIARAVLFLASELSSYMTGTVLEITGGRHI